MRGPLAAIRGASRCADSLKTIAAVRHVPRPALIDDRRASLTVLAQKTIRAGDYVVVTDNGATPLARTPWPGAGAILGRALEGIDAGHRGRVRDISSKSPDSAIHERTAATQRVWSALQRYAGWLRHDKTSASTRAAVDALGMVLDHGDPEATAAAIAMLSSEVDRLHAVDLKRLLRTALHDLRLILDSPKGKE
jgi:hypothetical protein